MTNLGLQANSFTRFDSGVSGALREVCPKVGPHKPTMVHLPEAGIVDTPTRCAVTALPLSPQGWGLVPDYFFDFSRPFFSSHLCLCECPVVKACAPDQVAAVQAPRYQYDLAGQAVLAQHPLKEGCVRFQQSYGTSTGCFGRRPLGRWALVAFRGMSGLCAAESVVLCCLALLLSTPRYRPVPRCHVGRLRSQGVEWIVHALGPAWQNYDARSPDFFPAVAEQIRRTVFAALVVTEQLRATGVTLPAISGGIFCHQPFDAASRGLNHKEQLIARRQLLQVTLPVVWVVLGDCGSWRNVVPTPCP